MLQYCKSKMGNKQSLPTMTIVQPSPRCVHRGCTHMAYPTFVMCLDHIKDLKRKQLDAEKNNYKKSHGEL